MLKRRLFKGKADDKIASVEIPVRLAGREHTLRFVGTHWFELNTVLAGNESP